MLKKYLELLKKGLTVEEAVAVCKGEFSDATEDAHAQALSSAKNLLDEENLIREENELREQLQKSATATKTKGEEKDGDETTEGDETDGAKFLTKEEFKEALKTIKVNVEPQKEIDPQDYAKQMGNYIQLSYQHQKNLINIHEFRDKAGDILATPEDLKNSGYDIKTVSEDTSSTANTYGSIIAPHVEEEIAKRTFMEHEILKRISKRSASFITQIDNVGRVVMRNLATHNTKDQTQDPPFTKQDVKFGKSKIEIPIDKSSLFDPYAQRDLGEIAIDRMHDAKIRNLVPQIISGKDGDDGVNSGNTDDLFDGIFAQAGATLDLHSSSADQPLHTDDIENALEHTLSEEFRYNENTIIVVDSATLVNLKQEKDGEDRYTDRVPRMRMQGEKFYRFNGYPLISTDLMKKTWTDRTSSLNGNNLPLFAGDMSKFYYAERGLRLEMFDQTLAQTDEMLIQFICEYKWIIPTQYKTAFVAFLNCVAPS